MTYRLHVRKFLNLKAWQMGAHVIARVEKTDPKKKWATPELILEISDCNRIINLDFDVRKTAQRNSLRKLDILIKTMIAFRVALVEEMEVENERVRLSKVAREKETM